MRNIPEDDLSNGLDAIKSQILDVVESASAKGVVVGLSGGIDSAVVCALCSSVVDTKAILMPEVAANSTGDINDAIDVCEAFDVPYDIIEIGAASTMITDSYPQDIEKNTLAYINVRPRLRMTYLYLCANYEQRLVVGTSNKTETLLGYCTKYGDNAADFLPIANLWKTEVVRAAEILNIPESILDKKPSAGLYEGQTDEDELGADYYVLDDILYNFVVEKREQKEISKCHDPSLVESIIKRIWENEHKRSMPLSLEVGF